MDTSLSTSLRFCVSVLFLLIPSITCSYHVLPTFNLSSLGDDIETIQTRRVQDIVTSTHNPNMANRWREELTSYGNWTDVDYTSGCPADRAVWKAPDHFKRIITMASLWTHNVSDVDLLDKIHLSLDHWFNNDFPNEDCINGASNPNLCPCSTPGFWNPNWWYQMILMPRLVGNLCLLLKPELTPPRLQMCFRQTGRSYERVDGDPNGSRGPMTGANLLDVTYVGVSLGLLTSDQPLLLDALSRAYEESELSYGPEDGIKVDGSFMQHSGQLLTGSYGAVFIEQMINTFMETQNTGLEPPLTTQAAFITLINGSEWFMYHKNKTDDEFSPLLMWQQSVIGRSISHKYSDWRGIGFNLNKLITATTTWPNHETLVEIVNRLETGNSINPGGLVGTRYFHVTDYLVHRGPNHIVTLKMFSQRTTNSECYNSQNPYGFHLSDGAIFTYLNGNEYTDVAGAWDWKLIPGTTVDYDGTPLTCSEVEHSGKEPFVGGLAIGQSGLAVMNYTNPVTGDFHWTKVFIFHRDVYIVQFVGTPRSANESTRVVTTLDQRHLRGPVFVDGKVVTDNNVRTTAETLWHDGVRYLFTHPVTLTVDKTPRMSNWTDIGSSDGNETQTHLTAYFEHPPGEENADKFTYMAFLNLPEPSFEKVIRESMGILTLKSKSVEGAVVRGASFGLADSPDVERTVSLAFLTAGIFDTGLIDIVRVETDAPIILVFERKSNGEGWRLAIADPSQTLRNVAVSVWIEKYQVPILINTELPIGAWAGSSVIHDFKNKVTSCGR